MKPNSRNLIHSYFDCSPVARTIAATFSVAPKDSAGATLLRKMGWRPGQGVGPRVTYEQLKKQDTQSFDIPTSAKTEEDDDEARKHLFAPRDTKAIIFRPKENTSGLGYVPGSSLLQANEGVSSSDPHISGKHLALFNIVSHSQIHFVNSWVWSGCSERCRR